MSEILVSVIIPVYNSAKYLEQCIDSVLRQTVKSIEVICIDDASEDESWDILFKYQQEDSRVQIFKNEENKGAGFCRNKGFVLAKGNYICFVDSDDYFSIDTSLEIAYEYAENNVLDILIYNLNYIYEDVELERFRHYEYKISEKAMAVHSGAEAFDILSSRGEMTSDPCAKIWRTQYLRENNVMFREGVILEDIAYNIEAIILANRVFWIEEALFTCRRRHESVTTSTVDHDLKAFKGRFICFSELLAFRQRILEDNNKTIVLDRQILTQSRLLNASKQKAILNIDYNDCSWMKPDEQLVFGIIMGEETKYIKAIKESVDQLAGTENLIIYGAGKVAEELVLLLNGMGINRFRIAVTNPNPGQYLFGNKVLAIDDIVTENKNALIVVAVSNQYKKEMCGHLDELGVKAYICP